MRKSREIRRKWRNGKRAFWSRPTILSAKASESVAALS